jgi:NAD(P)H-hydrate epimerase
VALAAEAALRVGAGWVSVAVAASLEPIFEVKLTEVTSFALPEHPPGTLALEAEEPVLRLADDFDVLVAGPGFGRSDGAAGLARRLVGRAAKPMVVDADALWALAGSDVLEAAPPAPRIVTPHPGEMARLVGHELSDDDESRAAEAAAFVERYPVTLILKGFHTVVAEGGRAVANATGGSELATLGTGDILAGAVAGLVAQGMAPFDAAWLGVYLHGRAGELASEDLGPWSVVAGDVLGYLPEAITEHAENGDGE